MWPEKISTAIKVCMKKGKWAIKWNVKYMV
jgi:hypothetical protein